MRKTNTRRRRLVATDQAGEPTGGYALPVNRHNAAATIATTTSRRIQREDGTSAGHDSASSQPRKAASARRSRPDHAALMSRSNFRRAGLLA